MPKDKTETHERIIPAAMKIFLEKGFEKATMREIAEEAGITAAGTVPPLCRQGGHVRRPGGAGTLRTSEVV